MPPVEALNFSINDDYISLSYQGAHFDLHNNFHFVALHHDWIKKAVDVVFTKGKGNWVPVDAPAKLTLSFENVSNVYENTPDIEYTVESLNDDAATVDMIGFSYDGTELMDGVTDHTARGELPAILFVFVTGRGLKVVADRVKLIVG